MEIKLVEPDTIEEAIIKVGKYIRNLTMYLCEVDEGVPFSYLIQKIYADFLLDIREVK